MRIHRLAYSLAIPTVFLQASAISQHSHDELDAKVAARFAELALSCVHREYPNKIAHVMQKDGDAKPPRELTPAFFGCFDWHSAVHGHWLLARLARHYEEEAFAARARAALERSLTDANIAAEMAYLQADGRGSFERPYGLAWLLQLAAELHEWKDDAQAARWARTLAPLERECARRFKIWFPKLSHPIRTGEHSQTAFAMGLVLDWARTAGDSEMESIVVAHARLYYLGDRGCPLRFEPGGQDFLSPCLAEADLMRRILEPVAFGAWLGTFLPEIPFDGSADFLLPATVTDNADGKLAHLDGLNLARAWMLDGIASGLPARDPRLKSLHAAMKRHAASGLAAVTGEHYAGGHWLGSYAVYLTTRRGR